MRHTEESTGRRQNQPHRALWSWAWAVAPLLAPFVISLVFILCYCGTNLHRGLACIIDSRLKMASGPKTRSELGVEGKRVFYPYELGEQITRVIHRNCGEPALVEPRLLGQPRRPEQRHGQESARRSAPTTPSSGSSRTSRTPITSTSRSFRTA